MQNNWRIGVSSVFRKGLPPIHVVNVVGSGQTRVGVPEGVAGNVFLFGGSC